MVKKSFSALMLSLSLALSMASGAFASNYSDGLKMMNARQYQRAIASFEQALRENPNDQNSMYCLGTCYYQTKDIIQAKNHYTNAVRVSAASPTGKAAMAALKSLVQPERGAGSGSSQVRTISNTSNLTPPSAPTTRATSPSGTVSSTTRKSSGQDSGEPTDDVNLLPTDARVRFHRKAESGGDHLFIDAYVNNRPITVMFDTGAEECSFGFNHLAQLGIPIPTGKPVGQVMGLGMGTSGPQAAWRIYTNVRIGNIERKNFPIIVKKSQAMDPLLGQSFFKVFHYTVETDANPETGSIHFTRSGGRGSGSVFRQRETNAEVPYTREGKEMLVTAIINGKSVQMYFDTGAAGVTLPKELAKSLGLVAPEDAREGYDYGTGGQQSKSTIFPVRSIKLGPIEKNNFDIRVVDDHGLKRGLIGQSLFSDWRYTIDSTNNVIKFKR